MMMRYGARAVKQRLPVQERIEQASEQFADVPVVKAHDPKDRLDPHDIDEEGLAKVRLNDQHLPPAYLKRVQQVFSKYEPDQLREIAGKFSELMNLMYKEQKVDYSKVKPFTRLKEQLPKERQVEQIILTSKERALTPADEVPIPKEEEDPLGVKQGYNHNTVVSYLLKRVPRTFATAVRIFTELRYKYPGFKPLSMIDFGSGLSSGSYAFYDVFQPGAGKKLFNIEPNTSMFKLSRFLSQDVEIQHYKALGELSRTVAEVDVVYAGYVLNEIESDKVEIYVEALWTKVKPGGFLVIAEYGNPYGARLIHDIRTWAIGKKIHVAAPCTHQLTCPLAAGKRWCHFDQPAGSYPRRIFGRLPTDHAVTLEKFSYLVLEKPGTSSKQSILSAGTNHWDRVLFPPMIRGGHVIMDLCTSEGKHEKKIVGKSHGPEYLEARKLRWGDLWRFGRRIPNKFRKESKKGKRLW